MPKCDWRRDVQKKYNDQLYQMQQKDQEDRGRNLLLLTRWDDSIWNSKNSSFCEMEFEIGRPK
jgi:hypothetical protein